MGEVRKNGMCHQNPGLRISLIQIAPRKPIYKAVSSKMTNCGAIGRDASRDPSETPLRPLWDPSREAQNIDFSKILGMASPGVECVPTSLETIFKLSRGPQRPNIEKSENFENLKKSKNPEIRPPYSPGLGPSYLARYAAPQLG